MSVPQADNVASKQALLSNVEKQQLIRQQMKSGDGSRAKTAGEMGMNLFRQASNQGRQTAQQGTRQRKREKISNAQWIEISPQEITFQDIEPNQIYEAYIYVRNLTQLPRRVRIQQPQTSRFRVDYDSKGALAAGLAMKLVLQFESQQNNEDFHDSIVIKSDDGFVFEVPVHAIKPQPNFEFQTVLDLGYAKVSAEKTATITFTNTGKVQGKIQLKCGAQKFKIDPGVLLLSPGTSGQVKITYSSNIPCVFRSEIQIIQQWCSIIRQIDVSCTVVDYSIFFLDSQQAQSSMVEFGDILLGNLTFYSGFLVNNTPLRQFWKSIVRKGFHSSMQAEGQLLTPNEVGVELLEKVITCQPEKGYIEPYAQLPIKIDCKGRITEEDIQKCATYALKPIKDNNQGNQHERSSEFQYSLFFDFENSKSSSDEQMILHISGKQVMPQLKINKQHLKFGDCPIHDTRDCTFWVENIHKHQSIDIMFTKVPQFTVTPDRMIIPAQVMKEIFVTFRPKNVGRVNQVLELLLVEQQFRIPIQLLAQAQFNNDKRPITRGPEALPQHFDPLRQFIDDSHIEYLEAKRKQIKSENLLSRKKILKTLKNAPQQNVLQMFFQEDSQATQDDVVRHTKGLSDWEQEKYNEKLQTYNTTKENQNKYTQFVRGERASRLQKKRDQILQVRVEQMEEKIKFNEAHTQPIVVGLDPKKALDSDEDEKDPKKTVPMDYEFQLGMMETGIVEPELGLPPNLDGLFVTRPIDKYEPVQVAYEKGSFKPDPLQPMKKKFPVQPQTHRDIRDINVELQGEELKKIQAGPVEIDFGRVFINSKILRTFHIKNDLRSSISAQIFVDREELSTSYQLPQIIPSSETARFEIALQSNILGPIKQTIRYVINNKHSFDFLVVAQIEPVSLELSRNTFKFQFTDESLALEVQETIKLTNSGNATAKFKWLFSDQKVFTVSIIEGEVQAQKSLDLQLTYRPANLPIKDDKQFMPPPPPGKDSKDTTIKDDKLNKPNLVTQILNQLRQDDDRLIIKITDGIEQVVRVTGVVNDAKCILKHSIVDMKDLLVCKPEVKFFSIRNQSRIPAIFKILSDKLPAACDILPLTGKIMPDESKDITVKYQAKEETDVRTDILILVRGGRILRIPFHVKTMIPQLEIQQDQFDFGKLTTLGNEGQLRMMLINHSLIGAELILDLRPERDNRDAPDGIECLQIIQVGGDSDESILKSVHDEPDEDVVSDQLAKQNSRDELESQDNEGSDNSSADELDRVKSKKFTLFIGPESQIEFILKFAPKDVKLYNFELPIQLNRFGKLAGLTRNILCRGLKPKFLMDPQQIDFARKIITSVEKCFPVTVEIVLSNPEKKSVGWRLDTSSITQDRTFNIAPCEGRIESGQTIRLKAQFNPQVPGEFNRLVPVFIDDLDQPQDKPYLELVLRGSAAQPKLSFDRREVLLPVVPLGVEARCTFRVLNDGYENLNLRHKVFGEEGNISVKLRFPEGQNIGITKNRLRVDAIFSAAKPISFTTRIEFYDDIGKTYSIPVSGTTDNCLLTNYPYLQRMQVDEYRISMSDPDNQKGPIMIIDDDQDVASEIGSQPGKVSRVRRAPSVMSSKTQQSHFSSRSTRSALGYNPIPQDLIQLNKQYVAKWMNFYIFSQNLHSFPESIIESDGVQIFELVCFISGKSTLPFPHQIDKNQRKQERVQNILNMYEELIRMLKSEGALLNHIRPYHLLSQNDLNSALKLIPKEELQMIHPAVLKVTQQRYNYISAESWGALFYQIIKIYALSRINYRLFRNIPGMPSGDKCTLPDYYINGSNLYSQQEGVLLRWLEVHNEQIQGLNPQNQAPPQRLLTFDKDLRDGIILANLMQSYIGANTIKFFQGMKPKCFLDEEYLANATKVFKALQEFNLQTPFELKNFSQPSGREMVLLIMHLLNTLPNYIPKGTPVIFQCVLGQDCVRYLELQNPTPKAISYWVKYEGVPDFILEGEDCFKVESKVPYKYKIKFISRVSQPVSGRITFTNKRESSIAAATLVYDLKSQIIGRVSEQVHNISSALYESKDFAIQIVNKFTNAEFGNFQITLIHERIIKLEPNKKKRVFSPREAPLGEVFPSIYCRSELMRLKRGQPYSLQLQFIPLVMDTQKCLIIFNDPNVGEFQHEIMGQVDFPEQIIDYKAPTVYVDQQVINDYLIMLRNEPMQKARKQIEQMMLERKSKKVLNFPGGQPEQVVFDIELTGAAGFVTTSKQFTLNDHHRQKLNQKLLEQSKQLDVSQQATINPNRMSKMDITQSTAEGTIQMGVSNKLPITYFFKNAIKELVMYMTLKNQDKTDVRKYRITINALPKPVKAIMEMECPARETVIQDIPIINTSDRDWTIKVNLQSDSSPNGLPVFTLINPFEKKENFQDEHQRQALGKSSFKDVQVKKKTTVNLQLIFSPKWICEMNGQLTLTNPMTNDIYDYVLRGLGEEPLAECHIALKCQARRTSRKEIPFLNTLTRAVVYRVETDVINASGLTTFTIQPGKKYNYVLTITPLLSGQYTGSITFFNDEGEYVWYTILLDTESPRAEKDVELITQARKPIAFDIELTNHMQDEQATYEVIINGDHLIGEKYFTVLPGTSSTYELLYLPLLPGKSKAQIGFVHPRLGELWYNLTLISEERQTIRIPIMKTELGKVEEYEVMLENPTSQEVIANSICSNPQNFEVSPETIILAPYDQTPIYIRYVPSNLDSAQTGEITIITKDIGKWEFMVFGVGVAPTSYPEKILTVGLNKDYSEVLNFKNPFKESIQIIVSLVSEDPEVLEVFKILLKTKTKDNKITISGMSQFQIPFSFTPREIRSYKCEIHVAMNDKIKWTYPMVGHTESFSTGPQASFKTKCRIPFIQEFRFQLPGMGLSTQLSRFTFEIKNISQDLKMMLDRCFKIKMLKSELKEGEDTLVFETTFNPMKPFRTSIDLIIQRDIGGVWKFPIQMEASPPEVDDLIVITSPLRKTSSVSFKLTNRYKQFATFSAKFTPNSDQEFKVSPQSGLLESFGRDGTQFIISFTPLEYGQIKSGKLVIETEEMYWSYNVKGTLPKYIPPIATESKINDHIDPEYEEKIQHHKHKNFLQQNITIPHKKLGETKRNSPTNNKTQLSTINMTKFMKTQLKNSNSAQDFNSLRPD